MGDEVEMDGTEGRLLAGRYRLADVLGRGGMGTVWRARDEVLGRTVAVKELRFPGGVDEDEKRRLITRTLREAKAIARIRNNGAVTVYDVVDEDDRPWIVMELVEGRSLAEVVRDDGPLTPRRAAEVGLAVLDVLRAAHGVGILHRDVKPSNVLMSDDGRVVLTDFGIAQVEGDPSVTSTGMLVGAPSYISPERARGQRPGPPADLWSLGGLLYACVEGVPPYDKGSAIATLTAVMTEPVEPPKSAGALEEVLYGLLVKDPDARLDDAGARALLLDVIHAPEEAAPEPPVDATRAMALPVVPGERTDAKSTGGAKSTRGIKGAKGIKGAQGASKPAAEPKSRGPKAKPAEEGGSAAGSRGTSSGSGSGSASGAGRAGTKTTAAGVKAKTGAAKGAGAAGAAGVNASVGAPKRPANGKKAAAGATGSSAVGAAKNARDEKNARDAKKTAGGGTAGGGAARSGAAGDRTVAGRPASAARPAFADAADAAKERLRGALQSVRNAAVAARTESRTESRPGDGNRPSVPRAPLTDVVPRRTLITVAVAVVVVLAVLGTILAVTLSGDDESGAAAGRDGRTSPAAKAGPSAGEADASGTKGDEDTDGPGTGAQRPGSTTGDGAGGKGEKDDDDGADGDGGKDGKDGKGGKLPDGFAELVNDTFHFRMAMPKGFHQTDTAGDNSGAIYSASGGFPRVQIDYNAKPGKDAAAAWRSLEPSVRDSSDDYHRIDIKPVKWRGYPTVADWSFTRSQKGEKVRILNRGFRADDDHGYAIMITCTADTWSAKECQQVIATAFKTFAIKD
ncbi:serine/threonine-protein kinase [Streptomyces sp. NBRC 110611]|uniref:serine/threonine-protein kinase n=1 Tax=Streptomyces sp. NBRC 110611 TaxID=1621259 RepID=UPI0008329F02|nr:serine/threonine-protein kinase [Streptomyces sp. NBRC 110611]GAU67502.1 serine/threonine-protein kinase [Streptomyces sp. NBRC 110611]